MTACIFWCTTLVAFCVVTLQFDFLGAFTKLQQGTISFIISVCLSVQSICLEQLDSYWIDFHEIWYFRIEFVEKIFRCHSNQTRITGTLHEDVCMFVISCWILLCMRNISDKSCREEQIKTHISYSITSFPKIMPFMGCCGKMWYNQTGHTWSCVEKMCFVCRIK